MAELADAQDLGSCAARRKGSTPSTRTKEKPSGSLGGRTALYYARGLTGLLYRLGPRLVFRRVRKDGGEVLAIDLSPRMLELASGRARFLGLRNVAFHSCDFLEAEVRELGWERRFDLVFTSAFPAIEDLDGLHKVVSMSRGYCFNSCLIYRKDDLEREVASAPEDGAAVRLDSVRRPGMAAPPITGDGRRRLP